MLWVSYISDTKSPWGTLVCSLDGVMAGQAWARSWGSSLVEMAKGAGVALVVPSTAQRATFGGHSQCRHQRSRQSYCLDLRANDVQQVYRQVEDHS